MKHYFWMLAALFVTRTHAQDPTGTKIPAAQNERYVSYANIPANRILFEKTDPHGFYRVLQTTVTEAARRGNSDFRGIAPEQVAALKKINGYTLGEQVTVPLTGRDGQDSVIHHPDGIEEYVYPARDTTWQDIDYRFGEQVTVPLTGRDGKDSVIHLADGTDEYIYPARETMWYSSTRFDEIVVREQLRTDPSTKKDVFVPVELFLRRKLPSGESIVTLRLNFDALRSPETMPRLKDSLQKQPFKWENMLAQHTLSYKVLSAPLK
jgi:hypothetical protein